MAAAIVETKQAELGALEPQTFASRKRSGALE